MAPGALIKSTVIFVLACGVYHNSLPNDFAFDDHLAIVNNGDTDPESPWAEIWRNDIWGKNLRAIDSHRSYRPLLVATFKLIRMKYGLNATAFRYFSILFHGIASILVYFCSAEVVGNADAAAVAAALFATHPVHVESIAAVVNMAEPLSCIFYIVAFLLYRREVGFLRPTVASVCSAGLWLLSVAVATLVKETGITAGGVVLADCLVSLVALLASRREVEGTGDSMRSWLRVRGLWITVSGLSLCLYGLLRVAIVRTDVVQLAGSVYDLAIERSPAALHHLLGLWSSAAGETDSLYLGSSELIRKAENPFAFLNTAQERVLSLVYLHFRYILVLVWPLQLSADFSTYALVAAVGLYSLHSMMFAPRATGTPAGRGAAGRSDGLLVAICWFIVTFVPMSGVFLTLGTLLAERLLYIPSIGFCIVSALLLQRISEITGARRQGLFAAAALVVSLYSLRTIQRNPDWADDATLHLASLRVCPRSAKLNLQVAKIRMNDMNFTGARWHVDEARAIDPEFCDVDFQYAMLELHVHKYEAAVPYLTKSLKCIYTNMQAWPILNQIWDNQVKLSNGNSRVYEQIGVLLNETGMFSASAKQFLVGASRAFDEASYTRAMGLLGRAEDSISSLERELKGASSGDVALLKSSLRELNCHNNALGGMIRSSLEKNSDKISSKSKKKLRFELSRAKDMLLQAVDPSCVLVEAQAGSISQFPQVALKELQERVVQRAQTSVGAYVEYGEVIDAAIKVQAAYHELTGSESFEASARQMLPNAMQVWQSAGESYFNAQNYEEAETCFLKLLSYEDDEVALRYSAHVPCSAYYWYAHALAGKESFLDTRADVESAVRALSRVAACPRSGDVALEEMRELAKDQRRKLISFLRESEDSIATPPAP